MLSIHSKRIMTKTELVSGIGIALTQLTMLLLAKMYEFETFGLERQWGALSRAEWAILVGAWKTWFELWGLSQEGEEKQNSSESLRDHSYHVLASSLLTQGLLLGPEAYWIDWACQPMSPRDLLISTFPDVELQVQLTISNVFVCLFVGFPMVSEDPSGSCTRELFFWEEAFSSVHPSCERMCSKLEEDAVSDHDRLTLASLFQWSFSPSWSHIKYSSHMDLSISTHLYFYPIFTSLVCFYILSFMPDVLISAMTKFPKLCLH